MDQITVWVEGWQMQCCGEPFRKGDRVEWTALKWAFDMPPLAEIKSIDFFYENHAGTDREVFVIRGEVSKIGAVFQKYELDPVRNVRLPVSGRLVDHDKEADGWEDACGEYEFSAYFVHLHRAEITSIGSQTLSKGDC